MTASAPIDAIAPLDAIAAAMPPDWRYRWRTRPEGAQWRADVQAGHADESGRVTGAFPCWTAAADTEADALARATADAVQYWTRDTRGLVRT